MPAEAGTLSAGAVIGESARLRLRRVVLNDAAFFCRLLNEPGFIAGIADRGVRTVDDASTYIRERIHAMYDSLGYGMYLAEFRDGSGPAGVCGILQRASLPEPDLGFALLAQHEGQGLACEAAMLALGHARGVLRLRTLLAIAKPANERSHRLLRRLGFAEQGTTVVPPSEEVLRLYSLVL